MHEVTATTMPAPHRLSAPTDAADDGPSADPADPDPDQPPSAPTRAEPPRLSVLDPGGVLAPAALAELCARGAEALAWLTADRAPGGEVRARLVADAEMADLHRRTLGEATTTDVLTFDLAGDPGGPLDADLALCVDEARRHADARGGRVEHELLLYLVHGVLHCLGYDDHDEAAAATMHAREDEALRAVGVGAVYARDAAETTP